MRSFKTVCSVWIRKYNGYMIFDTTLCDQVCQWLATGRWFSPGTPVSSINKTDHHDITETSEICLKVALNTTNQTFMDITYRTFRRF